MEVLALALGAALALACVVYVALPFLREPAAEDDTLGDLTPARRRRLALEEQRDRALGALKELEFDHRTGKVSDDDYRAQVVVLRREVAEALRALDEPAPAADPGAAPEEKVDARA